MEQESELNDRLKGLKVVVIGGGPTGLMAGHAFSRYNADVEIYERTKLDVVRGGALTIERQTQILFNRFGLAIPGGTDIWGVRQHFDENDVVGRQREGDRAIDRKLPMRRRNVRYSVDIGTARKSFDWQTLVDSLRNQLPYDTYFASHEMVDVAAASSTTKPSATFRRLDGPDELITREADLIVVADGANSRASALLGRPQPEYAGYVSWRGNTPISLLGSSPLVDALAGGEVVDALEWDDGTSALICFPVELRDRTGENVTHISWTLMNREDPEQLRSLLGDEFVAHGLAPGNRMTAAAKAHVKRIAASVFQSEPSLVDLVNRSTSMFARSAWDLPGDQPPGPVAMPGVAFLGDSAVIPRAALAMSTMQSAVGAYRLVDFLAAAARYDPERLVEAGLERWAQDMQRFANGLATAGRQNDRLLGLPPGPVPDQRHCPPPLFPEAGLSPEIVEVTGPAW